MNLANVKQLFTLFSGEDATGDFLPVITLAMSEVNSMLLDDADENDVRLEFLTAAVANFHAQQIIASSAKAEYTFIGKVKSDAESPTVIRARDLMRDYFQLCNDLIKPQPFVFFGFSSKEV